MGDEPTLRAIAEIGRWLGLGIGNLINIFNPDLVILGGLYQRLFTYLEPSVIEGAGRRTPGSAGRAGDDRVLQPGSRCPAHRRRRTGAVGRDRRPRPHQRPERRRVTRSHAGAHPWCGSGSASIAGSFGGARRRGPRAQRVRQRRRRRTRWILPTSSRKRPPPVIEHVYDGDFTYFVGGGVAAFDCDDDAKPDLYFAGGTDPAALYRNESPIGGALRFAQMPDPADRPHARRRRLPAGHRRRRSDRPRGPAARRERAAAWPGRLPVRTRERGVGLRRR